MNALSCLLIFTAAVVAASNLDAAELPRDVLRGWENLRDSSKTHHYALSTRAENSTQKKTRYQISARLKDNYAKAEIYFDGVELPSSQDDIRSVLLFDGDEYFQLERPQRNSKLALIAIGKNQPSFQGFKIGKQIGPSVGNVDLYECSQGQGDYFIAEYTSSDESPKVVFQPKPEQPAKYSQIEAWLDKAHDFRLHKVMTTVFLRDGTINEGTYLMEMDYQYDKSKSMPSKVRTVTTKVGAKPGEQHPPTVSVSDHLEPSALPASNFTLEYYGLPPYKRKSSVWIYVAITLAVIAMTALAYRQLRARTG